jgi:hypothetical protein
MFQVLESKKQQKKKGSHGGVDQNTDYSSRGFFLLD